jgi:hypothetical protein
MKIAVITSMDKTYYDKYGKLMIKSYLKHCNNPLYLYNEDFVLTDSNVICQGWNLGNDFEEFQQRWNNKKRVTVFSKKAFSIIHAAEHVDADRIIWIDADSEITKTLDLEFIKEISPDDVLSTHFGVTHEDNDKNYFSCETGFFILNKRHQHFDKFINIYKNIYKTDDYRTLRRFYDGEVYGETVQRILATTNAKVLDLNPNNHKTPIPRSPLGSYVSHNKGKGLKDSIDYNTKIKEL